MSFLDSITKILGNKKINKVLGVDIGSSSIKIVQLSVKKGVAVLDTFGEVSLSVYGKKEIGESVNLSAPEISEALRDLMKEAQVDATDAYFAIPLKSTLIFNLKLPKSLKKEELDGVVRVESRKYIPVPISEVQLDWSILPNTQGFTSESHHNILVVAIHKETLNKYESISTSSNLMRRGFEVETFSTIRSVIKHDRNTTAIVDIGASITKLYIVDSGIIRRSNIINIGASKMMSSFRDGEEKMTNSSEINSRASKLLRENMQKEDYIPLDLTRIINEIRKAIIEYQKKNKKDVPEIVFTGGFSIIKNLSEHIKKELAVDILEADPFSKVSSPVFLDQSLKEAGPEFAVALGVALRGLKA